MLWEILKASKGILVADFYADLWANLAGGGTPVDVFVEMIGSPPLYYNGKGYDLTDYLLSGNAVQDGTPSAEDPVDVVGCGVRTGNIADLILGKVPRAADGALVTFAGLTCEYVPITSMSDTFSLTFDKPESAKRFYVYFYSGDTLLTQKDLNYGTTITTYGVPSTVDRMRIRIDYGGTTVSNVMLAKGNTALPYEPYGHKLPLTVNGTEYPIYLGQVETTRRVKKLVLTGGETWGMSVLGGHNGFLAYAPRLQIGVTNCICSHYKTKYANENNAIYFIQNPANGRFIIFDDRFSASDDFKSYLAQQYAAGTPVTVWYVLAEPETAIVNEPLMKIGGYADTISFAQAGVTIPTVNGANVLDMASTVKPSKVYVKGKGIKPTGYGQLEDVNGVNILDKDGRPIYGRASDRR